MLQVAGFSSSLWCSSPLRAPIFDTFFRSGVRICRGGIRPGRNQVFKTNNIADECDGKASCLSVSVLRHDHLRFLDVVSFPLFFIVGPIFRGIPMKKDHDVGILLDRAGVAQIGQFRLDSIRLAPHLRKADDRDVNSGQLFQRS